MIDISNDEKLNNQHCREKIEKLNEIIKFIHPIFGFLANLFLLLPTIMLIFKFNDYNDSFELVSKVIIILHECIFGATLILVYIFFFITQFIQNSTAFFTSFAGKVVVGYYFSYCSILNCRFDIKKGFLNRFSCILGAIFMFVDCILELINQIIIIYLK